MSRHFRFKPFWAGKPYKFGAFTINRKNSKPSGGLIKRLILHLYHIKSNFLKIFFTFSVNSVRFPSSSSNNHSPTQEEELCITVADMFGFDSSNNGMEQFCTNWTAELMQQSYHECVFKVK